MVAVDSWRHRRRRSSALALALALAGLAASACTESDPQPTMPAPDAAGSAESAPIDATRLGALSPGENYFDAYCTECHGPRGEGDGPTARLLNPPPADLTRIAERRGGFDRNAVAAFIDGRTEVEAHGPREMPVWGVKHEGGPQPPLEEDRYLTPEGIREVVQFLETIQVH
jgi:mono/diheme cytochrome c family protein